ncbi:MAG: 30S ribosome-binding factor RbfA [Chloroflexi bacterium]|nr:30S ribosome-binding factor RbfA [Chloroflexota bacterium]MCL5075418.1 30S ribosome-binding factor RbfA [Chloroflexota bacterium]
MTSRRVERVNELIRVELSEMINRQMKDPRLIGMISVTEVQTAPDLRHAKVYISIMGTEEERQLSFSTLQRATGFFRRELGERLSLRRIPELSLHLDESLERGDRILRLLREIGQDVENKAPLSKKK